VRRKLLTFGVLACPLLVWAAVGWRGRAAPPDPLAEVREKVGTRSAGPLLAQLRHDRSGNAEVFLLSARQCRLGGQPTEAAAHLEQAEALARPGPPVERERSLLVATSNPPRARAALDPLLAADPTDADALLTLAEAELQLGRPDRAIELAEGVTQRLPTDARALYVRGRSRLQGRRLAAARADLEAAVAAGPDALIHTAARLSLASCLLDLGEFAPALQLFRAVRADDPANPLAQFGVGRAASYLGQSDEAERSFLAVLEVRPGHPETLLALAQVVEQRGDLERALGYLEQAEAHDPNRVETLARLVKLLAALGRSDRADRYEERYRKLDPTRQAPGAGQRPAEAP
jgi:tetratricopeptide (TPR) repeat protein